MILITFTVKPPTTTYFGVCSSETFYANNLVDCLLDFEISTWWKVSLWLVSFVCEGKSMSHCKQTKCSLSVIHLPSKVGLHFNWSYKIE